VLNYFGQAAFLIQHEGETLQIQIGSTGTFCNHSRLVSTCGVIATLAAVIASQALITGSFTLINEAMRLNLLAKVKIKYLQN
jgi:KUP system potassium uptake protein